MWAYFRYKYRYLWCFRWNFKKVDDFKFSNEDIERAFDTQRGEINQLPPIYSALKVNGKRMCDLVRSGRQSEITLKTRRVNIKDIKILSIKGNKVMFYVECSKGTYVRSICHDIGEYLGCGAHMSFLNRTSSGKFDLDNSITLEELELFYENKTLDKYLYDIDYVLDSFNYVVLNPNAIKYYSNGGSIDDKRFLKNNFDKDDEVVRVYSTDNFLGLGKLSKHNNTISVKSDKMFI